VLVVNDFEAQALAISDRRENRERLGNALASSMVASRVVLGPGTGLGVGGLAACPHTSGSRFPAKAATSISGRAPSATSKSSRMSNHRGPRLGRTDPVWPRHRQSLPCHLHGRRHGSELRDPADITSHALAESDKTAVETISLFSTYLGRVAGDMAMIFMARGGVFLPAAFRQKILPALRKPEFRAGFRGQGAAFGAARRPSRPTSSPTRWQHSPAFPPMRVRPTASACRRTAGAGVR
jgi:glucokinase